MKFEKAYKKYQEGTATEEEIKYVEKEISKAKKIIDQLDVSEKCEINEADTELLTSAKKKFEKNLAIKTIIISIVSLVVVGLLITGTVIGIAAISANNNAEFSETEAIELAEAKIASTYNVDIQGFVIEDKDKDLEITLNVLKSYFTYEIEFDNGESEYKVLVNASTGIVRIIDIEGVKDSINRSNRRDN